MTPSSAAAAPKPRVALFVDGENLPSVHADRVLALAAGHGDPVLRRVYGNVPRLNGWLAAPGFRVVHSGTGKNATDMLICVEAMHAALTRQAEVIVIAASDRDYAHLANYLRESGIPAFGIGEDKAAAALRRCFSGFHALAQPEAAFPKVAAPPAPRDRLLEAVRQELRDPRGMSIQALSHAMHRQGFRISDQPEKTWRKWLAARASLFLCDPAGPQAHVRLRQPPD